jgi:hypothetical protein
MIIQEIASLALGLIFTVEQSKQEDQMVILFRGEKGQANPAPARDGIAMFIPFTETALF